MKWVWWIGGGVLGYAAVALVVAVVVDKVATRIKGSPRAEAATVLFIGSIWPVLFLSLSVLWVLAKVSWIDVTGSKKATPAAPPSPEATPEAGR